MTWPGTVTICYGEMIAFEFKRANTDKKYSMKYRRGSCIKNGYGDRQDCDSTGDVDGSCSVIKDLRQYEDIQSLKPEVMQEFGEEVYCGKTLVGQQSFKNVIKPIDGTCGISWKKCYLMVKIKYALKETFVPSMDLSWPKRELPSKTTKI